MSLYRNMADKTREMTPTPDGLDNFFVGPAKQDQHELWLQKRNCLIDSVNHLPVHAAIQGPDICLGNHLDRSPDGWIHVEGLEGIYHPIGTYDVHADAARHF